MRKLIPLVIVLALILWGHLYSQDIITIGGNAGGGGGVWGSITGTLSSQTDLQSALDAKVAAADVVANGAAGDIPVYTDTNKVGPAETGNYTFSNGTFTGGAGKNWSFAGNRNTNGNFFDVSNTAALSLTSGLYKHLKLSYTGTFQPSSGAATFTMLETIGTVNQTGSASGISRGIHVNNTITAAADWRGIEVANAGTGQSSIVTGTGKVTFGGPLALKSNTVSFSATPTFDGSTGNIFHMELTGNVTSSTTSNLADGRVYTFRICTDGTGSYTFAWPTNAKGAMTVGTDANSCSVQPFLSDGTNLWAMSLGVINMAE